MAPEGRARLPPRCLATPVAPPDATSCASRPRLRLPAAVVRARGGATAGQPFRPPPGGCAVRRGPARSAPLRLRGCPVSVGAGGALLPHRPPSRAAVGGGRWWVWPRPRPGGLAASLSPSPPSLPQPVAVPLPLTAGWPLWASARRPLRRELLSAPAPAVGR